MLSTNRINTPCYIIVGGVESNEGVVIVRSREGADRFDWLSEDKWFVA